MMKAHRSARPLDAHTWVLTCANDHPVITFNAPNKQAECPLCAALGRK